MSKKPSTTPVYLLLSCRKRMLCRDIVKEKSAITMCARQASKLLLLTHITC